MHAYADNTQIYGFCHPSDTEALQQRVSACVKDVALWMKANRLQLNPSKTEIIWCSSFRRQHQIPMAPVRTGDATITPSTTVRDLGVYIDADTIMRTHVTLTVRLCFAALRQIRSIRRSLPPSALQTLIQALVVSKLDYCSSVMAGASGALLRRLQSVLNAAARMIFSARRYEHITPLLRELHWLKAPERIQFRLCVLVHRCLHDSAPTYMASDIDNLAQRASECLN
jgi:hypothetical protein